MAPTPRPALDIPAQKHGIGRVLTRVSLTMTQKSIMPLLIHAMVEEKAGLTVAQIAERSGLPLKSVHAALAPLPGLLRAVGYPHGLVRVESRPARWRLVNSLN